LSLAASHKLSQGKQESTEPTLLAFVK